MRKEIQEKYDRRVKNILDTTNLREPEKIPIMLQFTTWVIGYYGLTVQQCLDDPETYIKTCNRVYEDFEIDCIYQGLFNPLETCWALGSNTYFVSSDGVTVQHQENAPMKAEEYPELIADPMNFFVNKLFARKYPALNEPYPQNYQNLKKAAEAYVKFVKVLGAVKEHAMETYGVVSMIGGRSYPPFDVIFDRLRGFNHSLTDLRRHSEYVAQAVDALLPIYMKPLESIKGEFPFPMTTMHAPHFMRTSDFEKYFWPSYKKMLMKIYENGGKTIIVCEGAWDRYFDLFRELPKGAVVLDLDRDDIIKVKKRIGDHCTLCGNIALNDLKWKSKEECIDIAKHMVDECAPGGGFIFGVDQGLISTNDVNPETLKAVLKFVSEYK